jgi:hypothetical protein
MVCLSRQQGLPSKCSILLNLTLNMGSLISNLFMNKHEYGKVNKQWIPLTNNAVIKETLGKYDILFVEDLVHEIITAGPNFKQASNFLWPFKLSNPTGG